MNLDQKVRDAAVALKTAIEEAERAGYRVMGVNAAHLASIAVSETAKVSAAAKPAPGDEYENMHKSALVELATARGIEIPSGATKSDVIAALKSPPSQTA